MGVLITMAFAGGLGGVLCNLRGIFKFYRDEGYFPARFVIPFYLRPVMGAAAGVLMFFIGHLLSSALSDSTSMSWATLPGRLPYVAFALLAGFAVQEFNEWMKETAKTLFSDEAAASISEVEIQELARWEVKDDRLVSPEMNLLEPVGPRQVIVMCGDLLGEGYAWRVFLPGELICAPRGSSTAYRVVGGTDSARRAQARQIAKINALPALNAGESWESREVHTWC